MALQRQLSRLTDRYEVVQNTIGDVFIENSLVAKLLQIQFQTLELDAQFAWYVAKDQRPKVGLTCFRANRRKLRASNFDFVSAIGKTILENFELVLKRSGHRRKFSLGLDLDKTNEMLLEV